MPLIKNQTYTWDEILRETDSVAGPVYYLLHRRGTHLVTAAALDIVANPRAPYEVWPGAGEKVSEWAEYLDQQTEQLDVFVREADDQFYYRGKFRRTDSSTDANEIELRSRQVSRGPIYKIIYLTEDVN